MFIVVIDFITRNITCIKTYLNKNDKCITSSVLIYNLVSNTFNKDNNSPCSKYGGLCSSKILNRYNSLNHEICVVFLHLIYVLMTMKAVMKLYYKCLYMNITFRYVSSRRCHNSILKKGFCFCGTYKMIMTLGR